MFHQKSRCVSSKLSQVFCAFASLSRLINVRRDSNSIPKPRICMNNFILIEMKKYIFLWSTQRAVGEFCLKRPIDCAGLLHALNGAWPDDGGRIWILLSFFFLFTSFSLTDLKSHNLLQPNRWCVCSLACPLESASHLCCFLRCAGNLIRPKSSADVRARKRRRQRQCNGTQSNKIVCQRNRDVLKN